MSDNNFDKEFERALEAGEEANTNEARGVAVRYDPDMKEIIVELQRGGTFSFLSSFVPELRGKSDEELADVQLSPSGGGLHWERLDLDLILSSIIAGNYGRDESVGIDLDQLYLEIETGWYGTRDASLVDRLAESYPQFSSEIYEFFATLIESEVISDETGAASSAEKAHGWLKATGFEQAQEIAASLERPTTTTPDPEGDRPSMESGGLVQPEPIEEKPPEPGKVLSFAAYARSKAGLTLRQSGEKMDVPFPVLMMIEDEPPDTQLRIRREIARLSPAAGLDREESYKALLASQQKAALNTSTGPPKSFRTRLANVGLTSEQLEFWLSLADEESE